MCPSPKPSPSSPSPVRRGQRSPKKPFSRAEFVRRARLKDMIPVNHSSKVFRPTPDVIPSFRTAVRRARVRFGIISGWTYYDGLQSYSPHMVLYNSQGHAHAVLNFDPPEHSRILIRSIQRDYSTMRGLRTHEPFVRDHYLPREREVANTLREKLGVHPSELLLSQFVYHFRSRIRRGTKVFLHVNPEMMVLYHPLVERFFKKRNDDISLFELSLDKRRVREALGLPSAQK